MNTVLFYLQGRLYYSTMLHAVPRVDEMVYVNNTKFRVASICHNLDNSNKVEVDIEVLHRS